MHYALFLMITLLLTILPITAQEDALFWYSTPTLDETISTLCHIHLNNDYNETCIDIPTFSAYAISPNGSMLSFISKFDRQVHIFDIATQDLIPLQLCQPIQEFLWDDYYDQSGTLIWSPDGRYLAFTGVTTLSCDVSDPANIYIYDAVEGSLSNLTTDISITWSLIIPTSWSPDSEFLTLFGVQSVTDTGELNWGSAIITRDGTHFREIASNHKTCRLAWSPDMQWLTSDTACHESIGTGSDLIFVPFDPDILPNATEFVQYIDDVISPIYFGFRPTSGWTSQYYAMPIWINEHIAVTYRTLTPISGGYLNDDDLVRYSSSGIVAIDMRTMTETMLAERVWSSQTIQIKHWFITNQADHFIFFNPVIDKEFTLPATMIPCLMQYSVQLSSDGNYIAIIQNCSFDETGAQLLIYDTNQLDNPVFHQSFEMPQIELLGFSR